MVAVKNQFRAMGCERYDIGIKDKKTGKMMNRELSQDQIVNSIPWLKRMNARGNDIYVRPAKSEHHSLVLVDDIDGLTLAEMRDNGHSPCCVIETSPKNHQAWVKNGDQSLSAACRGEIGKTFVEMYRADKNSADPRHYGRLAGFTNRKPQHENRYGQQPYCLLRDSSGKAIDGHELIQKAESEVQNRELDQEKKRRFENIRTFRPSRTVFLNAEDEYKMQMQRLYSRYGKDMDLSRADWMVCTSMLKSGYHANDIKGAMMKFSPNIESRKASHLSDYVNRTVNRGMQDEGRRRAVLEQKQEQYMGPRMSM